MADADLFTLYFNYRRDTEPPPIFHRWAMTACIGAWLGRTVWLPFGAGRIFPNQYVMFIGDPGSRKTTAIKMATAILRSAGYDSFGAQRTSKEKFLLDLAGEAEEPPPMKGKEVDLDRIELLNSVQDKTIREMLIDADEFNNFMGAGNLDFQSILGELWDWDSEETGYKFRLKNSRSVEIFQPTISILAGNTPSNFALCFPPASIGQGFMSRLILIHGESTGRKIAFPEEPPENLREELIRRFVYMRRQMSGRLQLSSDAKDMLTTLYETWPDLEDIRFKHYSTRRFTHLLRLCIIYAASRLSMTLEPIDVIKANTVLAFAESKMPTAMGELGKAKNSEAANKIMQLLAGARQPVSQEIMWKSVRSDLDKPTDLTQVLTNLQYADLIQFVRIGDSKKGGYLAKTKQMDRKVMFVDYAYLKGKELP